MPLPGSLLCAIARDVSGGLGQLKEKALHHLLKADQDFFNVAPLHNPEITHRTWLPVSRPPDSTTTSYPVIITCHCSSAILGAAHSK